MQARRALRLKPAFNPIGSPRLGGPDGMLFGEWRERVVATAARRPPKPAEPLQWYQLALADIYWLMEAAPDEAAAFEAIPEPSLQALAEERAWALEEHAPPPWTPPPLGAPAELMLSIAVEARALDDALWTFRDKGAPDDPDLAFRVPHAREIYLVPRKRYPGRSGPKTRQPFTRRGLLHHRVFPREIGGAIVKLVEAPRTHHWGDGIRMGGALFENLALHPSPVGENGFLIDSVRCDDLDLQFQQHLDACVRGEPCVAALWPELTIPPRLRDTGAAFLRGLARDASAKRPGVAVFGTWHEHDGTAARNVARIFSGYGDELASYAKMRKFAYEGREEAIEIGRDLPIVIVDDLLLGFGICKDFCDRNRDFPYQDLDLDLVLVPSFGSATTMNHHLITAAQIRVQYGAYAFIAQQAAKKPPKGQGWVAGLLDKPEDYKATDIVKSSGFETYADPAR